MSKMSLIYNGNLRSEITHTDSGKSIVTDAPKDNNGLGESFSPTDMTASSLAACMITIIGILNEKKDLGIQSMNADIEKIMASEPRRISKIKVKLTVKLESATEKIKAMIKNSAKTCPVALSLHQEIIQEISFEFI